MSVDIIPPVAGRPADPAWEAWFDREALTGSFAVRPRRLGERIVPFGGTGSVGVSRLLAAHRVPRLVRGCWPVLVNRTGTTEEIVWVIGIRRAAAAPVTGASRAMVRIRATPVVGAGPPQEALS